MNDQNINDNQFGGYTQAGQGQSAFDDSSQKDRAEAVVRNLKMIAEEKAEADLGETAVPAEVDYHNIGENNSDYLGTLELHDDEPIQDQLFQQPYDQQPMPKQDAVDQASMPPDTQVTTEYVNQPASQEMYLPPSQTQGRPFIGTHEVPQPPQGPTGTSPLLGE